MIPVKITRHQGYLHIANLSLNTKEAIKKTLSLENILYKKMARMGKPVWFMKPYIEYFSEKNGVLIVGRGCREGIIDHLVRMEVPYEEVDKTVLVGKLGFIYPPIPLRDYQVPIYDEIDAPEGILKLGTGFGKTLIALDLSQRSGQKTLIIVHRQHLMEQYITEIKKFFPGMRIGIIKGQERTIGDITIAMSQTLERMFKNKTLSTYENQFGLVIVDECHEYITKKRLKVIQSFNSRNFYGMSGSPERTDEQDKAITFTFGRVLTDHALPQIPPTIHVVKSNIAIPAREYHLMIEEHVANLERNALICRLAMNQKAEDRKTLILVKRVEHLRRLEKILDDVVEGFIPIYAKMPAKEKTKLFADLRSGEKSFSILAGSYSLLATGSDFPSLDTLLLAGDLRSRVLSKQSVGRIMRLFKGKQDPLVVDIRDRNNPILENQFKERRKLYKKLGWKLIGDYE